MTTEIRTCLCGCTLPFTVNSTSSKMYLNRKHKTNAKDQRRKLKEPVKA